MAIQFHCPGGHLLSASEQHAGKKFRCPRCKQIAQVPARATDPRPPVTQAPPRSTADKVQHIDTAALPERKLTQGAQNPGPDLDTGNSTTGKPPSANGLRQPKPGTNNEDGKGSLPPVPPPLPESQTADGSITARISIPAIPQPPPLLPNSSVDSEVASIDLSAAVDPIPVRRSQPATMPLRRSVVLQRLEKFGLRQGVRGYQAEKHRAVAVYWLALGLGLLSLFQMIPAAGHLDLAVAPDWARIIMLTALLQLAYIVCMVLVPDWSTAWIATWVFTAVATLYGTALALVVVTPRSQGVLFGLDDVRDSARLWCSAVVLLTGLMAYVCGRLSTGWYRSHQRYCGDPVHK